MSDYTKSKEYQDALSRKDYQTCDIIADENKKTGFQEWCEKNLKIEHDARVIFQTLDQSIHLVDKHTFQLCWESAQAEIKKDLDELLNFKNTLANLHLSALKLVNELSIEIAEIKEELEEYRNLSKTHVEINDANKCVIEDLKKENDLMKEALGFYASTNNWLMRIGQVHEYPIIERTDMDYMNNTIGEFTIGGKLARETLLKITTNKEN